MCGIGGIIAKPGRPPQKTGLDAMLRALHSRGPDGNGTFADDAVAFAHARLSIIDVAGGAQPIIDAKGRILIFNGEIYNYRELRAALSSRYAFKTNSDSETILAAYDAYGPDCANHLRGMYAFALYDPARGRVILARDPFGIKPMYLAENADGIAFASEPKALFAAGFAAANVDVPALRQVLKRNFIGGTQTAYTGVTRMSPGETRLYEHGALKATYHRSFLSPSAPRRVSEADALAQWRDIWAESVDLHCRSDVGYGVFLSGGVDSSSVMAALRARGNADQIRTYTAYFDVGGVADERDSACAVNAATGTKGTEVPFGAADFDALLPAIAAYMDDPVCDYAILPTWKLAAVAAREQKVVLSGEGGDELFAGYGRYRPRFWKDWKRLFQRDETPVSRNWSRLQRAQARDIAGYLPCDLLVKLDTCLMAHGLEGRTPFLDSAVADFAFGLPDDLKLRGKTGKYLVKHWLNDVMPASQPFRRKRGFTVPVGQWMAGQGAMLGDRLSRNALVRELLSAAECADLPARLRDPQSAKSCWGLLYLALWQAGKGANGPAPGIAEGLSQGR